MVEIRPFKALMYNQKRIRNLARVTSPPYDIISEEEQNQLYHNNPRNFVRLLFGKDYLDDNEQHNKYLRAAMYSREWINENILVEDDRENIYVYEMEFSYLNKVNKVLGFIALVKLEYFEKGLVRPHELTFPKPKEDRLKLMKATKLNQSQIYSMYPDSEKINKTLKEKNKEDPVISITDEKGVKHKLWKLNEKQANDVISEMKNKHIFIADGHHRYETALTYRDSIRDELTAVKEDAPYNFTSMFLVGMEDNDLVILPTHRLIRNIRDFDIDSFLEKLEENFEVKKFIFNKEELSTGKRRVFGIMREEAKKTNTFCIYLKGGLFYLIKLKDNKALEKYIDKSKSTDWNKLDVIVCQRLIIENIFDKKTKEVTSGEDVSYTKNDDWAVQLVEDEKYQLAILLNPPTVEQVKKISNKQEKMPHKTTYFYPKPICGLTIYKLS